ncbi:MAG: hypothetical protein ACOC58_04095 [Chloroflexota bacterium]
MSQGEKDYERNVAERMAEEEGVQEKVSGQGTRWRKVYFGGGAHFRHWLAQVIELCGEENVETEEVDSRGFQCFEQSGEKLYRIWVRQQ